jgi:hypothetical protein
MSVRQLGEIKLTSIIFYFVTLSQTRNVDKKYSKIAHLMPSVAHGLVKGFHGKAILPFSGKLK